MQLFGSAALGQAKSKAARRGVELPESFRSGFLLKLQLSDSWTRRKRKRSPRNPSIRGSYYIPPIEKKTEPERSSVLPQLQGSYRVVKQSLEPRADPRGLTEDTARPAFSSFSSNPAPGDAELPDCEQRGSRPFGAVSEACSSHQAHWSSACLAHPPLPTPGDGRGRKEMSSQSW